MWLLLVSVCLAISGFSFTSASEPHYVITVPATLSQGAEEKACVTFLDLKGAVDLKLELKKDDQVHIAAEHKIDANDHSECYLFKVPIIEKVYETWSLHVTVHGDHINADESKKVLIMKHDTCIIETNKLTYKPGDTVKFRVISVDRHYHATDKKYPLVEIIDPNKNRIEQWLDVSTNHGFAEFSFHLANELSLGQYQIKFSASCEKQFEVAEYVLKRFEVNIIAPSSVALTDKSFHLEACGRYTFGKPAEGSIHLSICAQQGYPNRNWGILDTSSAEDERNNCIDIEKAKTDSKGCLSKDINLELFNISKSERNQVLKITASLAEDQTGHVEEASTEILVNPQKSIKFLEQMRLYQRGLLYRGKVKVTDENKEAVPNQDVYIYVESHFGHNCGKPYKTVTDMDGLAYFTLNTSEWESFVMLKASFSSNEEADDEDNDYSSHSEGYAHLAPLYSQSESSLSIEKKTIEIECNSDQTVTVAYDIARKTLNSDTHLHFFYLLQSIQGITLYKEHKVDIKDQLNNPTIHGSFPVNFHVDGNLFPIFALIVFSVLPNGETIANLMPYEVPLCANEKAQLKFSEEQVHPGASVNLEVSAKAGSLCSVRSLDKGYLLQHPRKSLLSEFIQEFEDTRYNFLHRGRGLAEDPEQHQCPEDEMPESMFFPSVLDVKFLFECSNLKIFTNAQIKKPLKCVKSGLSARKGTKAKKTGDKENEILSHFTRRHFPDSWLFELVPVGSEGHTVLNRTTPHSITKWVTNAFCLSKTGFAEVKDIELTTFQPYFIDLIVPYSVVQAEKFTIEAVVFSYVDKCVLIVVSLPHLEDLVTVNNEQARCVCEGHSHRFTWVVTALKPKTLKIHVDSGSLEVDGKCTEDPLLIRHDQREDSVEKTIVIKPKGHEEEKSQTFLIDPSESKEDVHITLTLPERLVPGSERAHIIILGDLMANVAVNLDNFFSLPDGCGEQNIAKFSSFVSTLEYLKSVQELKNEKKAEIIDLLVKSYQKQMTFKAENGSYGIFPGGSPNIWITSLIVKAFIHGQNWIYIDDNHIQQAVHWLRSVQLPNGCFTNQEHYFNNELEADNDVARTAYIAIALLEHPRVYNGSIVEDALSCLRKSVDSDTSVYTQALLAYAFTLSGDSELRAKILKKLDEKAEKKEGTKRWKIESYNEGEIETTSYILLALLSDKTTANKHLEETVDIVRTIVNQQNPYGGFRTSQDTAVALQALAKYAEAIHDKKGDTTVTINSKSGFQKTVHVDKSNSLLLQTVDLPEIPGEYTVSATGNGFVYLQSHIHYNILPDASERHHFSVNVSTEPSVCTHKGKFDVHVDVSYIGTREHTNMAVILIEPVSGYIPYEQSIKKLRRQEAVKKVEVSPEKVSIYLERITHESESLVFTLKQEIDIENLQPATVVVYDYYNPDKHTVVEYSSPCSAGSKQTEDH